MRCRINFAAPGPPKGVLYMFSKAEYMVWHLYREMRRFYAAAALFIAGCAYFADEYFAGISGKAVILNSIIHAYPLPVLQMASATFEPRPQPQADTDHRLGRLIASCYFLMRPLTILVE